MKQLIACLLGTLILSQPIYAHNLADVIEDVLPSITYIEVESHTERKVIDTNKQSIKTIREKQGESVGTGFIIEDNKVVTNYHVIQRAALQNERIFIKFDNNNGVRYEAKLLGYDEVADVALLEIEGKHPSLTIATDADVIRMGDDIFTISNYYSIRHSATVGVVSSNNRINTRFPYIRLLQLQILQGSGSSGGPVLNEDGKVVALNHTILSMIPDNVYKTPRPSLMSMTAFTIRGDQLARSIKRIKKEGVVRRADLGLFLKSYGMNSERYLYDPVPNSENVSGIVVLGVDVGGPQTFKKNDIITMVDDQRFTMASTLLLWLAKNKMIGDTVKLQVYRDGEILNITTEITAARRFR